MPLSRTEEVCIDARHDVSVRISEALHRRGFNRTEYAARLEKSKAYITNLLKGSANLTIDRLATVLEALDCRFDLVVTPKSTDEIAVKKILLALEDNLWEDNSTSSVEPGPITPSESKILIFPTSSIRTSTGIKPTQSESLNDPYQDTPRIAQR